MSPKKPKPLKPHKSGHYMSVEWGKFRAEGAGFGVVGIILLYASPGLVALLVKVLVS